MGFDGPLYAFSLFTPSIINQLGFKATQANLLSVPVYAWACLITCVIGFLGDRIGRRCYTNLALFSVGKCGIRTAKQMMSGYFRLGGIYHLTCFYKCGMVIFCSLYGCLSNLSNHTYVRKAEPLSPTDVVVQRILWRGLRVMWRARINEASP